ncbi:MAG: hypothetical protein KBE22_16795, partial [Candidatus Accumulibacter sp.]|nr:hypothetical protein [Accumulibacter sp.]
MNYKTMAHQATLQSDATFASIYDQTTGFRVSPGRVNVKETAPKATENLTSEGHWFEVVANQATAGMKPKRVSALIQ